MCDGVENERWDGANVGNRLERLETLSLGRQEEEEDEDNGEVSAAQGGDSAMGEGVALDAEESPRAGDKRSAVSASAISSSTGGKVGNHSASISAYHLPSYPLHSKPQR